MRTERFDCKECNNTGLNKFGGDCIYCDGEGQVWREVEETEDKMARMSDLGAKYGPLNVGNTHAQTYWDSKNTLRVGDKVRLSDEYRARVPSHLPVPDGMVERIKWWRQELVAGVRWGNYSSISQYRRDDLISL